DHESLPAGYVPGRLLHVTPHAYFSWPRGWMPSKQPHRPDLLETMNDHLGRYVPVGETDYEDSFLPQKYRHSLLVDRWGEHKLPYYPIEHRGASFKAEEKDLLICRGDARPVGVAVGRGGRVFVTVCYMAANDTSPTYRSDVVMITRADDPDAQPFTAWDPTQVSVDRLYQELSNPDWSNRQAAHVELLRRGGDALAGAVERLQQAKANEPARTSLIWLAARTGGADAVKTLTSLTHDRSSEARVAAINALAEFPKLGAPDELFAKAIADPNPQVQLAAINALFGRKSGGASGILQAALSDDSYVRQAATMLMARELDSNDLSGNADSPNSAVRLAVVLTAGFRLTMPPATADVPESLHLDDQAQRGAYTIPNFAEGPVDLRKLGRAGNFTMAAWWKNVPHTPDEERLFSMLSTRLSDDDKQVRYEAAFFLNLLNDPRTAQEVAKVLSEFQPTELGPRRQIGEAWIVGPFRDQRRMFEVAHEPELGPINLAAQYEIGANKVGWKRVHQEGDAFLFDKLLGRGGDSSYYAFFRLDSVQGQPAILLVGSQQQVRIWQNGRQVWDNWAGRRLKRAEDRIPIELQPGGNDILVRVHAGGSAALTLDYEAAHEVHVTLPDALDSQRLAERLTDAKNASESGEVPPEFLKVDWNAEWKKGNREHGRQLFESLGCSKCHSISAGSPGGGGPSLADAGKRFTAPYVVESILLPSKQVSPLFRATIVRTNDGQTYYGLVLGETADTLEMRLQDTTLKTLKKSDINARKQEDRSPMPQGLVRTPGELRDLLAFVLGDANSMER
ncbi:MAG TPA: HEAT repeat domain-containing protein, partial [Tepidisphaeraceae bacterium]|nr:HEAT repeat domain-containing protein [Tepidisphaeraceae bacterium]